MPILKTGFLFIGEKYCFYLTDKCDDITFSDCEFIIILCFVWKYHFAILLGWKKNIQCDKSFYKNCLSKGENLHKKIQNCLCMLFHFLPIFLFALQYFINSVKYLKNSTLMRIPIHVNHGVSSTIPRTIISHYLPPCWSSYLVGPGDPVLGALAWSVVGSMIISNRIAPDCNLPQTIFLGGVRSVSDTCCSTAMGVALKQPM